MRNFLWLDLETTGLNPAYCGIIQQGIIVTTPDLVEIARADWLIRPADNVIWEPKAAEMHAASGLRELVLEASINELRQARRELLTQGPVL